MNIQEPYEVDGRLGEVRDVAEEALDFRMPLAHWASVAEPEPPPPRGEDCEAPMCNGRACQQRDGWTGATKGAAHDIGSNRLNNNKHDG